MIRMIIRAWVERENLFYFFGKSCPYFIDISFHVTQSSSWYNTERKFDVFHFGFPLGKKNKKTITSPCVPETTPFRT